MVKDWLIDTGDVSVSVLPSPAINNSPVPAGVIEVLATVVAVVELVVQVSNTPLPARAPDHAVMARAGLDPPLMVNVCALPTVGL